VYGEAGDDIVDAVGEGNDVADGGPGDDVVTVFAWGGASVVTGGDGADFLEYRHATHPTVGPATLDGGNGPDTILAQHAGIGTVSTATGGRGNDTITITSHPAQKYDLIASTYFISGGPGDDMLTGGDSIDVVDGGTGSDAIDVRGGKADTVSCGSGHDTVLYDWSDAVSGDCESASLG
jgi:Ca2+-binding RTX toxin-like protein